MYDGLQGLSGIANMKARLFCLWFNSARFFIGINVAVGVISGAAPTLSAQPPSTGGLRSGHPLHLQFQGEQPRPLAMVAGDFDEDGVGDLAIGYAITATGPTYATVIPGGSVNFTYLISPLYGDHPDTVSFTVAGLPPGATYILSQNSIPAASGMQALGLTVKTAPLTERGSKTSAFWSLALLLLPLAGSRRLRRSAHRVRTIALLECVLLAGSAALLGLSGCGAGNGFFDQPPVNYTVTVTATSGTMQHVSTVTMNLQ
jgi:hypothetical protein